MTLTPEERQKIYEEEKARLFAREQLAAEADAAARKRKGHFWRWVIGSIFGIWAISVGVSAFKKSLEPVAASSSTAVTDSTAEQVYLSRAAAYIGYMTKRGLEVGNAMTQVQGGQLTLGELERKFKDAHAMAFSARNLLDVEVPESCRELDGLLHSNADRFEAGCDEVMKYWKDGNADHIESGTAAIEASARLLTKANNERIRLTGAPAKKS